MAISLVSNVAMNGPSGGGTSTSIDTTGANLIIISLASYFGAGAPSVSDNKGNTYTSILTKSSFDSTAKITAWYCLSPTVGTGHTFTFSVSGSYPTLMVSAWSGAATSSVLDEYDGIVNSSASTSITLPAISPAEDNELIYTALCGGANSTESISDDFTKVYNSDYNDSSYMLGAWGYKNQTTAEAENPTWSGSNIDRAAIILSFKAEPVEGNSSTPVYLGTHVSPALNVLKSHLLINKYGEDDNPLNKII